MRQPLTDKQLAAMAYLRHFEAENDALPTDRTMAKHGYIERNAQGCWRFVRLNADTAPDTRAQSAIKTIAT